MLIADVSFKESVGASRGWSDFDSRNVQKQRSDGITVLIMDAVESFVPKPCITAGVVRRA